MKPISAQADRRRRRRRSPASPSSREDRERRGDRDEHDDPAHRRRARLGQVPLRPVVAHVLAELAPAQEVDELRREEDADQQGGGAADQDLCHQRRRERVGDPLERHPARALDQHGVAGLAAASRSSAAAAAASPAWRCSPPPKRLPRPRGARADGDEQRDARRLRLLPQLAVVALLVARPELEHVAEHGDAPAGGGRGKLVERGAHRHRVRVVAVVDDDHAARQSIAARRAAPRTRHRARRRRAPRPSARAAASAAHRSLSRCAARKPGSSMHAPLAEGDEHARRLRAASTRRRPRARSARPRGRRAGTARAAARRPAPRPSRPRASPSISSALAAAIASSEPSSSRCAGPTLTITPTSGSQIAVSSAICPRPAHRELEHERLGPRRRREDRERHADLGVLVVRARDRGEARARAARRGCPSSRSSRSSR